MQICVRWGKLMEWGIDVSTSDNTHGVLGGRTTVVLPLATTCGQRKCRFRCFAPLLCELVAFVCAVYNERSRSRDEARAQQDSRSRHSSSLAAPAMDLLKGLVSRTDCRIHNESESIIRLIPKSYIDGAAASSAMVREELVREIQPKNFIDVDSRKYDLNGKNHNMQIKIHFVAADVPSKDGEVHPKQHDNAAYPKGVEVATKELVFLHYELKDKREIRLNRGKGGKVVEVNDKLLTEESTKPVHQNKK